MCIKSPGQDKEADVEGLSHALPLHPKHRGIPMLCPSWVFSSTSACSFLPGWWGGGKHIFPAASSPPTNHASF